MEEGDSPVFDLSGMHTWSLRFRDGAIEVRYMRSTEAIRKVQMRMALLVVGILYCVFGVLDVYVMPDKLQHLASTTHLAQGAWLCLSSFLLRYSASLRLHAFVVAFVVFVAWCLNLFITIHGDTTMLFGEAYLMLVWVWLICGLTLQQAAKVNLLFLIVFEAVSVAFPSLGFADMLGHQFFVFVSVVLGGFGAYLAELYRRQRFVSLEKTSEQAAALATANAQLAKDSVALTKLSQAVEQSGEAILITDSEAAIEYANPTYTAITGYPATEVAGRVPVAFVRDARDPAAYDAMWETIRQGGVWRGTLVDSKSDGSTYPALISVAPIRDDRGHITHFVITHRDMTEHQRLEDQLRHAQKMEAIGTLVGGIAHDFNNTLAGITGNVHLAKMGVERASNTWEILDRAESLAFRSADIVKQLLAFSRKGIVNMQAMDAASFLADVVGLYEVTLPENIRFHYRHDLSEVIRVRGDSGQLEQAILNLLNNARDAVAGVGEPEITLQIDTQVPDKAFLEAHPSVLEGEYVRISVSDNGSGIAAGDLEHIFEPFYTTKAVNEGTGLGLSMAYGTAQSHGGIITAESEPGKGAVFRLYLPLLEAEVSRVAKAPEEADVPGSGATILLADDNPDILDMTGALLEQLDYRVLKASDGAEAVDVFLAHRQEIRLVVLDVVMPHMGGIEASHRIRAIDAAAKIIFVTGYDPSQQFNTEEMASAEVVTKPFRIGEFSRLVKTVLER